MDYQLIIQCLHDDGQVTSEIWEISPGERHALRLRYGEPMATANVLDGRSAADAITETGALIRLRDD